MIGLYMSMYGLAELGVDLLVLGLMGIGDRHKYRIAFQRMTPADKVTKIRSLLKHQG